MKTHGLSAEEADLLVGATPGRTLQKLQDDMMQAWERARFA